MRILKKQKGFPFLIALGTLFLLSTGFLAVQLFSDGGGSSVQALETPVVPPMLPVRVYTSPKKAVPAKETGKVVEQNVKAEEAVDEKPDVMSKVVLEPVVELVSVTPVKSYPVKATGAAKPIVVAAVPVKKETIKIAPKSVEPTIKKTAKIIVSDKQNSKVASGNDRASAQVKPVLKRKAEVVSPAAKITKSSKQRVSVRKRRKVDESVVPPEWNWFNKPLQMELSSGKLVIMPKNNDIKKTVRTVVDMTKTSFRKNVQAVNKNDAMDKYNAEYTPKNTFNKALAKIKKINPRREAEAKKLGLILPSQGGKVRSKSLRALLAKLEAIKAENGMNEQTLNKNKDDVSTKMTKEVAVATKVQPDNAVIDVKSLGVNEYHGSGSSFSARVQSLIRSGAWLNDSN